MNIVIIGGGFGGVYAAKHLLKYFKNTQTKVTLIDPKNYFTFIPMLHEVATGGLCGHNLCEPYRNILKGNFDLIKDWVESIDLIKKKVKTAAQELHYDYLVIATGSKANFRGIKGAERNTYTIKDLRDAIALKNSMIESIEKAHHAEKKEQEKYATVAVIGAGATGIELSLEIKEFLDQLCKNSDINPKVLLIQHDNHILAQFPNLQKNVKSALEKHKIEILLNSPISEISEQAIQLKYKTIAAGIIVWTAGIRPNIIKSTPLMVNYQVNEFLQLQNFSEVFAIGDCAAYISPGKEKPIPALAQVAAKEGKHAAKNIFLHTQNKPLEPFSFELQGILLSLGKRKGVALIKGIKFSGFFAWWLMRTIYLTKIVGISNKFKTAYDWTLNLFSKRDTSQT